MIVCTEGLFPAIKSSVAPYNSSRELLDYEIQAIVRGRLRRRFLYRET